MEKFFLHALINYMNENKKDCKSFSDCSPNAWKRDSRCYIPVSDIDDLYELPNAKACRDYCDSQEAPNFTYRERGQKCTCTHKAGRGGGCRTKAGYISGPAKGCSDGINCRKQGPDLRYLWRAIWKGRDFWTQGY